MLLSLLAPGCGCCCPCLPQDAHAAVPACPRMRMLLSLLAPGCGCCCRCLPQDADAAVPACPRMRMLLSLLAPGCVCCCPCLPQDAHAAVGVQCAAGCCCSSRAVRKSCLRLHCLRATLSVQVLLAATLLAATLSVQVLLAADGGLVSCKSCSGQVLLAATLHCLRLHAVSKSC